MTNSPLSPENQTAQDDARTPGGQYGTQVPTAHEKRVALLLRVAPETTVRGSLITVKTADAVIVYEAAESHREPVDGCEAKASTLPDGSIEVGWPVREEEPGEYRWEEGNTFARFPTAAHRDAYIFDQVADGVPRDRIFIADSYQEDGIHYEAADESVAGALNVLIINAPQEAPSLDSATFLLEDYAEFSNGDVYGVASVTFTADGLVVNGSEKEVWGFVGIEEVQAAVTNGEY